MTSFYKCLWFLLPGALLDTIIPVPCIALFFLYVLWVRPLWFKILVDDLYK